MLFEEIQSLKPYFFSLREIDDTVSLDMKFPVKWRFDFQDDVVKILPQDQDTVNRLISFVAPSTKDGYKSVVSIANGIVKINIEEEEKEKLFQEKVSQLKELFLKESLDKLKEINLLKDERIEDTTGA